MPRAHDPEMDPALAGAVRRACEQPVGAETAQRHMTAILAEAARAQGAAASRERPARGRLAPRRAWRPALAFFSAVLALPAGLAAAGVSLPDAIESPYSSVGVHLPNQGGAPAAGTTTTAAPARPADTTSTPATAPAATTRRAARHGNAPTPRPAAHARRTPAHPPHPHTGSHGAAKPATPATGVHGRAVTRPRKPVATPPAKLPAHAPRHGTTKLAAPKKQRSSRPARGRTDADGTTAPDVVTPAPAPPAPATTTTG